MQECELVPVNLSGCSDQVDRHCRVSLGRQANHIDKNYQSMMYDMFEQCLNKYLSRITPSPSLLREHSPVSLSDIIPQESMVSVDRVESYKKLSNTDLHNSNLTSVNNTSSRIRQDNIPLVFDQLGESYDDQPSLNKERENESDLADSCVEDSKVSELRHKQKTKHLPRQKVQRSRQNYVPTKYCNANQSNKNWREPSFILSSCPPEPLPFDQEGLLSFSDYLKIFEHYTCSKYGCETSSWLMLLQTKMTGIMLQSFERHGGFGAPYEHIKERMLADYDWAVNSGELVRPTFDNFRFVEGSSLYDNMSRLLLLFMKKFPGVKAQNCHELLLKLENVVPPHYRKLLYDLKQEFSIKGKSLNWFELEALVRCRETDIAMAMTFQDTMCSDRVKVFVDKEDIDGESCNLFPTVTLGKLQKGDYRLRKLYKILVKNDSKASLPKALKRYQRFLSKLSLENNFLMFTNDRGQKVPLVSRDCAVDFCLQAHCGTAHIGSPRLFALARSSIFHPDLKTICDDVAMSCITCQANRMHPVRHAAPVIKIVTNNAFDLVAVDLVQMPLSQRQNVYMLFAIDHNSKYVAAVPLRNKRGDTVGTAMKEKILPQFLKHPTKVLSDRGSEFTSREFKTVLEDFGINHVLTSSYSPASNGCCERGHQTLSGILRGLTSKGYEWDTYLSQATYVQNHTLHKAIGMSPADYLLSKAHQYSDRPFMAESDREFWSEGDPRHPTYKIGETVMRKVTHMASKVSGRFHARFEGPCLVTKVHQNQLTYDIKSPETGKEWQVHDRHLRPWRVPPMYLIKRPIFQKLYEGINKVLGGISISIPMVSESLEVTEEPEVPSIEFPVEEEELYGVWIRVSPGKVPDFGPTLTNNLRFESIAASEQPTTPQNKSDSQVLRRSKRKLRPKAPSTVRQQSVCTNVSCPVETRSCRSPSLGVSFRNYREPKSMTSPIKEPHKVVLDSTGIYPGRCDISEPVISSSIHLDPLCDLVGQSESVPGLDLEGDKSGLLSQSADSLLPGQEQSSLASATCVPSVSPQNGREKLDSPIEGQVGTEEGQLGHYSSKLPVPCKASVMDIEHVVTRLRAQKLNLDVTDIEPLGESGRRSKRSPVKNKFCKLCT